MNQPACDIGIDVSQKTLDVHSLQTETRESFDNDPAGISKFMECLASLEPRLIVWNPPVLRIV